MPLDRTWYNTLVDDDGSGLVGTIWNKAAVDALMDAIDAALAPIGAVGTWSPADASGAGLVFTAVTGRYVVVGKLCFVTATFTFPATANGAQSKTTLPFLAGGAGQNAGGMRLDFPLGAGVTYGVVTPGTTAVAWHKDTSAGWSNAERSGTTLVFSGWYLLP